MKKRILCAIFSLVILMGQLPAMAVEKTVHNALSGSVSVYNPLYEDIEDQVESPPDDSIVEDPPNFLKQNQNTARTPYTNIQDAAAFVRRQMANRQPTVTLSYKNIAKDDQKVSIVKDIVKQALVETDNVNEGDYLRWQYGKYTCNIEGDWVSNGDGTRTYTYKFIYLFKYYTTADQEREFNEKMMDVLQSLHLEQATEYQKIHSIYEYITQNVKYEYDDKTTTKYTAYSALMRGSAVCQGYALLFYRMLREVGISTRIIAGTATGSGENHAWNIAKLGNTYYYFDSTWDAGSSENWYDYFMRGTEGFLGHEAWADYTSKEFLKKYPVAKDSYEPTNKDVPQLQWKDFGTCGNDIAWTLSTNGVLTLRGNGKMTDYAMGKAPWNQYSKDITTLDIGCGITSIGTYAFDGCQAIRNAVILPDSIKRIGKGAFLNCTAIPSVDIMPNTQEIAPDAFSPKCKLRGCANSTAQQMAKQQNWPFETVKNIADTTITLSEKQYTYSGKAYEPNVTVSSQNTAIDMTTITYDNNMDAGTAMAVVSGTGMYGGKTAVPFTIQKAVPQVQAPKGLSALRGQTLQDILLSGGFTWENEKQSVGTEIGTKTFYVTYKPADSRNYTVVNHVPVEVTVHNTIWLSNHTTKSCVGAKFRLIASALPDNAPDDVLYWSSDDPRIASVSKSGVVTAQKNGTTTIHVRSTNGEHDQCTVTIETLPFTDVKQGDWYYDAVSYAYSNKIFTGDGPQVFHPKRNMSRAMLVQVLYSLEGNPKVSQRTNFVDVKPGEWYVNAIDWAVKNKIASGIGNNQFAPDRDITREQTAKMLHQYAELKGYPTAAYVSISSFDDDQKVSNWAIHPMQWAVGNDLLSGIGHNMLNPRGYATRAQVAQIMTKFQYNFVYN